MDILRLKKNIANLPKKPGIYIFKSPSNKPLYIGKALNLKNRLANYLKTNDTRIQKMISLAKSLSHIQTESDIEALILESQYIKKYKPAFNIMLRDNKQYSFVGFTDDAYPKIFLTHQPQNPDFKNYEFIGPFTDGLVLKSTLAFLRKIFPYCTCKQKHNNYCLNYHIGKCPGFCCLKNPSNTQDPTSYRENIKSIKYILRGEKVSLIKNLKQEMNQAAKNDNLEKAINIRNKVTNLERIFENARIIKNQRDQKKVLIEIKKLLKIEKIPERIEAYDISNIQGINATGSMVVFENGQSNKNEYRKFKIFGKQTADDTAMLKEILTRRLKHTEWTYPDLILIDGGRGQFNASKSVTPAKIPVIALTKDEKHMGHKIILSNGKEISLSKLPISVKNIFLNIDNEAHRFAISYYRKLHRKAM